MDMQKLSVLFFLFLYLSCEVAGVSNPSTEEGEEQPQNFRLATSVICNNATDCNSNAVHGQNIRAIVLSQDTCATYSSASEVLVEKTSTIVCMFDSCLSGWNVWETQVLTEDEGVMSVVAMIDTDGDGNYGETGEPFFCLDSLSIVNGETIALDENGASGTMGWQDF